MAANTAPALIWECTKSNSSFIRKPLKATGMPTMSAEVGNLCGIHCPKYSSIASNKALGIAVVKTGKKETIVLTTTHKKGSRVMKPGSMLVQTGLNKKTKKGLASITKVIEGGFYRKDLAALAATKYMKVKTSLRKKAIKVKSRRA